MFAHGSAVGLEQEQGDVVGVPVGAAGVMDEAVHELVQGKVGVLAEMVGEIGVVRVMSVPGVSTRPSV